MGMTELVKRDTSWLAFNYRVLQEAMDKSVPLYERIKFLAIYSANLDEFYRVRVASLRSFRKLRKKTRKELDLIIKPKKELRQIRQIVQQQQEAFGRIFRESIIPELKKAGIHLVSNEDFTEAQQDFVKHYFFEKVYPCLNPVFIESGADWPFLVNKGLYFIIDLEGEERFAIVRIPTDDLPRFQELPSDETGSHYIAFLDDIIRHNLPVFLDEEVRGAYAIKVSRNADLNIEDEYSGDLMAKIRKSLEERNIGAPTRFLYDNRMPDELLGLLKGYLKLSKHDIIPGARYHNFNDFFGFPNPTGRADLHNEALKPLPHPELEQVEAILPFLKEQDAVLHFPYQKYDYIPRLIKEAAADERVVDLKITLYRVASRSAVVEGLLEALKNGKSVTAFIEAKARFDEATNLYWGEELEKAGAKVIYSYPGIKVHTKLLLVSSKEEGQLRHYAYMGTGNFNEGTARLYGDHALLTADPRLSTEVAQVFDLLERKVIVPQCKHMLVSPFTTRSGLKSLLKQEIKHAKAGREAYAILKMNSLEDPEMIERIYEACQAGVKIKMIVRGICCAVPGVKGVSDNFEVISIVDRFLEHGRVYIFGNGGAERLFLASADWMTRNLDRRVEVVFPVYDEKVRAEIRHIIDLQLQDNTKARIINAVQNNPYRYSGGEPVRAQMATYRWLQAKVPAGLQ
jgi:polyphosphate kinase